MSAVGHSPTTTKLSGFIDDSPLTPFHRKLTLFSSGGPFIDGYVISIIGFTWASMGTSMEVTNSDKGLILLRFLVGMAIGADYPIATSLLAEYLPASYRGRMLGATFVVWAIGAAVAPVVGMICTSLAGDDAWRWMLASPALFAVLPLGLRLGTPESPRWLVSQGRTEEAEDSIRRAFGPGYGVADLGEPAPERKASLRSLFQGRYLRRTLFVSVFWMCQVIPMLSIYSFSYDILAEVGLTGNGAEIFLAVLFVGGGVPGLLLVDRIGRKPAFHDLECVAAEGVAPWGGTTCRGPGGTGGMMRSSDTPPVQTHQPVTLMVSS